MNNNNDPVLVLLELYDKGIDKERAYRLTVGVERLIANNQYDEETKIAVYNILSNIYIWNNDYEKAKIAQHFFLSNIAWCETNEKTVERYLLFVFSKNNKNFIADLVDTYPEIKRYFIDVYKSYLSMIVNPDDEENFDPNNYHYYNKFQYFIKLYQ